MTPDEIRDLKLKANIFRQQILDMIVKNKGGHICLDITKIRKTFGFEPKVEIKEGLKRTIDWNLAKLGRLKI